MILNPAHPSKVHPQIQPFNDSRINYNTKSAFMANVDLPVLFPYLYFRTLHPGQFRKSNARKQNNAII